MRLDDFPTPNDVIDQCLNRVVRPSYRLVLEPAAGDGRICKKLKEKMSSSIVHSIEIQEKNRENLLSICDQTTIGSFLDQKELEKYDLIITNPPYSMAEEYVHKSLQHLESYGQLVLLLRLGFLESQGRWQRLWNIVGNRPTKIFVLSKRPSFTGNGTDATAYAWFVWDGMFMNNNIPLVFWLPPT